jgi:hypothetical protein
MENDIAIHPEWTDYIPTWSLFGDKNAKLSEGKCPFSSLLN